MEEESVAVLGTVKVCFLRHHLDEDCSPNGQISRLSTSIPIAFIYIELVASTLTKCLRNLMVCTIDPFVVGRRMVFHMLELEARPYPSLPGN